MAERDCRAESARGNPQSHWQQLCATLDMARVDAAEDVDSDEEVMLLGGALADATWKLLTTPAPDLAALAYKLEVFRDEATYELADEMVQSVLNALIADARRLSPRAHQ